MAARRNDRRLTAREEGVAMITTLMVLVLVSALMVGFTAAIMADNRASGLDRDQTQAYAAAHAGLEQLTADLSGLFATEFSPTAAEVSSLTATPPTVPNFTFVEPGGGSGYRIGFTADPNTGNPMPESTTGTTIAAGPYQGLRGIITPYNITVTARSRGGAEVRMRRTLQTVSMPVFQFGFFSDQDLGFHAGSDFEFGGRVHTNGSLYLTHCCSTGNRLTLPDRITAVNEVIRTHLMNGLDATGDYRGTVRVAKNTNNYRNLATDEGSLVTNDFSVLNEPKWTALSVGTYASYIRNGRTGARRLELPMQTTGSNPIELIRRPPRTSAGPAENTANPPLFNQRLFAQASIRILLSDTSAAITELPTVSAGAPLPLDGSIVVGGYTPAGLLPPLASSGGGAAAPYTAPYSSPIGTSLVGGFIKIEQRTSAGWQDVTLQILNFGIAGRNLSTGAGSYNAPATPSNYCAEPNPNAIIRLQRLKDVAAAPNACGVTVAGGVVTAISTSATDYWPNTLYDTREGNLRDGVATSGPTSSQLTLAGVIHYIELDVNNLRRWIEANPAYPGGTGAQTVSDNGYIVYFSDRRGNRDGPDETGEFGYEDFVNPATAAGTPNTSPDAGEDVNGNGTQQLYGGTPRALPGWTAPFTSTVLPYNPQDASGGLASSFRANQHVFFRRALKLVNGGLGNLPSPGFTVASENPIYVQGNYNATSNNTAAEPNSASAIIADAVTLLSNDWNDIRSFTAPNSASGRNAAQTGFRVAVISGKSLAFSRPTAWTSIPDFGTDGGAHDFLRFLETWDTNELIYSGSLVSFFTSRQAVGTYKSGVSLSTGNRNVFSIANRQFTFDTDFLAPSTLPPGTPSFRDVNTLTFRQLLRPTQ